MPFLPTASSGASWHDEECHGKIDHLFGLRDNDGLALEASEPMPLPTVIAFDVVGCRFTLPQLAWWDDRSIWAPLVRAVHFAVPSRQAIRHLFQLTGGEF